MYYHQLNLFCKLFPLFNVINLLIYVLFILDRFTQGVAGILNIQETPGHSPIRDDVYTVDSIPPMYVGLD